MTKKDYQLIAKAIKKEYDRNVDNLDAQVSLQKLVGALIPILLDDNARFDSLTFSNACGTERGTK